MPKRTSGNPPAPKRDGDYVVVYLNGKKIRLGRHGTEEADKAYRRFIAEWATIGDAVTATNKTESRLIDELAVAFLAWAESVYGPSDFGNFKTAIGIVLKYYTGTLVKDFDSSALIVVQEKFVKKGFARRYCNKLTSFVRKMFVWGVPRKYATSAVAGELKLVPSVHRKLAKNRPRRKDVADETVKRTLEYLNPTIADMVRVQRLAVMRPSEVCRMKVGEIDRSGEVWVYRPPIHKNSWRNDDDSQPDYIRVIPLGKYEQSILVRRMAWKGADDYIFTPAEAMRERWQLATSKRKTKVTPSQQRRKEERAKKPKRKYRECYSAISYAKAIKRTIEAVNEQLDDMKIKHWTPYQLRHTAVTELTKMDGAGSDTARAVAGHKSLDVTMGYNHADEAIAIEAAKKRQNPLE